MRYGRTLRLAAASSLLALIAHAAHAADVLIDTGLPTSELFSTGCSWRAGQITSHATLTVNGIQNYVQANQSIAARVTLRADENGLPGAVLFSTQHVLTVGESLQGPTDLSWTVGSGTYWFTFEYPYANPEDCQSAAFRRRLGFPDDGTNPPRPLAAEALLPWFGSEWTISGGRTGWRVTGTQAGAIVNGREWRQLTATLNLSWNQVAATVCNATTGACSGSLGTVSFDGWTWASNADIQALFDTLVQPGITNFPLPTSDFDALNNADADIAAVFDTVGFQPTLLTSNVRLIRGRSRSIVDAELAYEPVLYDALPGFGGLDGARLGSVAQKTIASIQSGIWLYRDVNAPILNLSLSASTQAGCKSVTGTVKLSAPAPAGGSVVTLSDTLASASTPAAVTLAAGATSKTFTVKTLPVATEEAGTVSATIGSQTLSQPLTVRPMGLTSITLSPTTVVGSNEVTAKATLECKAGPGPITVELSSNNAAVASPVAASVVVPQGLQSANFDVTTNAVHTKSYATIAGTANGTTKSKKLTVNVAAAVSPTSLKFGSVLVGQTSTALNATLTNKGAVPFSVGSISLTGTGASSFAQTNNCPANLAAGASCTISVTFTPQVAASRSAKLTIATSATSTPLSVSLSGTGVAP